MIPSYRKPDEIPPEPPIEYVQPPRAKTNRWALDSTDLRGGFVLLAFVLLLAVLGLASMR